MARLLAALAALALGLAPAAAHDIYTGVTGKNGQLCCGGSDCAATIYRERGGAFEFATRENAWIEIPATRVTFLPIPGDAPPRDSHAAHLCYRAADETDRINHPDNVFGPIYLYCAFIPPGGV